MERIKLVVPGDARATIVQVKRPIVLSNLLELKKLEECQRRHPAIVPAEQINQARNLIKLWYSANRSNTRLLYSVEE